MGQFENKNPNSVFFSNPKQNESTEEKAEEKAGLIVPEGYKLVPDETRNKHAHILLAPSLHKKVMDQAKRESITFNELVNRALTAYTQEGRR